MNGIGDGIQSLFIVMAILLLIFIPLGIWKLIELIIALTTHLHWTQI